MVETLVRAELAVADAGELAARQDAAYALARVERVAEAVEGLLSLISEWFAGDIPPQIIGDYRFTVLRDWLAE